MFMYVMCVYRYMYVCMYDAFRRRPSSYFSFGEWQRVLVVASSTLASGKASTSMVVAPWRARGHGNALPAAQRVAVLSSSKGTSMAP